MKIYLLCTLDSEHYREPYFYFFEAAFAAHKWVIDNLVSITEESREEVISELEYKNVDGSDDQIMRIDYSYGDGEFYVNTIHEIEIKDEHYQNQPFKVWKDNLNNKFVIALIPFIRNLIEY